MKALQKSNSQELVRKSKLPDRVAESKVTNLCSAVDLL